ncbi:uncharacterized protein PHACADRAFT_249670 [Phanerochaete carnosa HHB-10118-sp]|uniref:CASTOR ACT domain-containing protein n=1 Tax=Phanerochaete carnosa (strain HHB-10118-sp) TaxID=650164 RepID=K5W5T4_PHACS|nr:uncharacterized protein PHACADRAFT_249670 [Phanerochaete carnosa HHB-10118-sp]EKM59283.1 hypothetical protein PHACADRAFT_249670 [Phanerochaete carnosa HHB-10118-sp]
MASSVTVSLLPVSLSLVHIPRSRIHDNIHSILRQLLLPSRTFLNVTINEVELSIFAEHHTLQDFELAAHEDARLSREQKRKHRSKDEWKPVEISFERWNVLQIDSHSDGLDNTSGARVHELSAPLAAAGVSILYQSSYMSDFIFVKEHRLSEVMSLLGSAGFDLYQSDPDNLTSQLSRLTSPIISPLTHAEDDDSSIHLLDLSAQSSITPENGAVLTRSRSNTDSSPKSSSSSSPVQFRDDVEPATPDHGEHIGGRPAPTRSLSHSPSGSDVRVLDPDLTCIGLSDDNADLWGLKIVKLVAFPDLILPTPSMPSPKMHRKRPPRPPELAIVASVEVVLSSSAGPSCTLGDGAPLTSESECETIGSANTPCIGELDKDCRASSESPIFDLDEQARPWDEIVGDDDVEESSEDDESSDISTPVHLQDRSLSTSPRSGKHRRPNFPHYDSGKTAIFKPRSKRRAARRSSPPTRGPQTQSLVPFFSFTRTPEGSSLTAPVSLLAALFPASERYMVICSSELDMLDSRAASPVTPSADASEIDDDDMSEALPEPEGTLKCLQIDLRRYGLDKFGLVSRYSRTLEANGINHLYSSTYKTANLLVDKAHAGRAQALLRSC